MPGKRRWVRKGARTTKGWKRTGKTRKSESKSDVLNPHVMCKTVDTINRLFPERFCTKFKFTQQLHWQADSPNAWGCGGNFLHDANTNTYTGAVPFPNTAYNQPFAMQGINLLIGNPNSNVGPYNSYRVNGSSVNLRAVLYGSTSYPSASPCYIAAYPVTMTGLGNDALGNVNTFNAPQFREYQYSKVRQLAFGMNSGVSLTNSMTTAKMYGLKYKSSLEDSNYSAQYGSNPEFLWGWVFAVMPDTISDVFTIEVFQTVTYDVEFFDRNVLAIGTV